MNHVWMRKPAATDTQSPGIRMRVSEHQVKLVYVHKRKWWQFWKPKFYPQWLAQTDLYVPIAPGSRLSLEYHGNVVYAKVNDKVVLTHPTGESVHRSYGFGRRAGDR